MARVWGHSGSGGDGEKWLDSRNTVWYKWMYSMKKNVQNDSKDFALSKRVNAGAFSEQGKTWWGEVFTLGSVMIKFMCQSEWTLGYQSNILGVSARVFWMRLTFKLGDFE